MDDFASFGQWLRRRRKALDLTQDALARQIGCAIITIQKIEADERRPSRQVADRLADALAIPPGERDAFVRAARAELAADRLAPAVLQSHVGAPAVERTLALPAGTVTFLFTDIEGSTVRWERYPAAMGRALDRHDAILRQLIEARGGVIFKFVGDGCHAVFTVAADAVAATLAVQRAIAAESWIDFGLPPEATVRVRMALHTGAAELRDGDYFGPPLNRVARMMAIGHGGQVLLSAATWELARDHLAGGVELRELGEYHLKDLTRPERIFQLCADDLPSTFPPLRTLDQRPHNLPVQPTALIGRERETDQVCELLRRPDVRLVTLTGTGGTGKTRLSLQTAAELLDDFRDGVWFVALAAISDPTLVPAAIAQALARQDAGDPRLVARLSQQETGEQSQLARLKQYLREKRTLLVLDNFEQVIDAAPALVELLVGAPGLKMLVTSRIVLRVSGEREYAVPPLDLPNPREAQIERLTQYESVRLFIERSQAVKPDFAITNENAPAVAEICVRLDGLPLAIELAAVRSKLFSPQALLARLDNRLAFLTGGARELATRQRTLRAAIDWSYDLLSDGEQLLFARLSVFVGGCTLEAAETMCQETETSSQGDKEMTDARSVCPSVSLSVFDGLASLVDKSLLRQIEGIGGEPRFMMLETLREYAVGRLSERGEIEALRDAHTNYYLRLAETAADGILSGQRVAWLARLDAEHDNLRAALAWSQADPAGERELRLAAALWRYWVIRQHVDEGRTALRAALARPDGGRTRARAAALLGAGVLASMQGESQRALGLARESVALWRALGDKRGLAYALADGSEILGERDRDTLIALSEETVALFRAARDRWGLAVALYFLGNAAALQGDYARMRAMVEEGLALFRSVNDRSGVAWGLSMLAYASSQRGDNARARALFEEGLAISREMGDHENITAALIGLGWIAWLQGDADWIERLFTENLAMAQELSMRWSVSWSRNRLGWAAWLRSDLAAATELFEQSRALFGELDIGGGLAWSFCGLAYVAWSRGQFVAAGDLMMRGLGLFRLESYKFDIAFALNGLGLVTWSAGDRARAAACFAESLAIAWEQRERWNLAAALEGAARLVAEAQPEIAARIYGAAAAERVASAAPLWGPLRAEYERALAEIRAALGPERFEVAWSGGRAEPIERVVAEAQMVLKSFREGLGVK